MNVLKKFGINLLDQPYHWSNFNKLKKDRKYINFLYEKTLKSFAKNLNDYFKVNRNLRYWRIIIGPWLIFYITSMFDRWEVIRLLTRKKKKFYLKTKGINDRIFYNYNLLNYYNKACEDDLWNEKNYLRILNFKRKKNYVLKKNYSRIIDYNKISPKKINFYILIDKFLSFFGIILNKNLIESFYFSKENLIKIFFKSKIFPAWYISTFKDSTEDSNKFFNIKNRKIFFSNFPKYKKSFEKYLFDCFVTDFPTVYFERFNKKQNEIKWITKFKKKNIFTMISHTFNEKFKFYAASMILKGTKLNIVQHGGGQHSIDSYFESNLEHYKKIGDTFLVWSKKNIKNVTNEKQLSPIQLLKYKDLTKKNPSKLLVISYETLRYPMKTQCFPYIGDVSKIIDHETKFFRHLNSNIQKNTIYRYISRPKNDSLAPALKKKFQNISFHKAIGNITFKQDLKKAKLVLCTYLETPFIESIISDTPTILFFHKKIFKFSRSTNNILNRLEENKIFFNNPKKLALHVKKIWINPKDWWNSKKVKKEIKSLENSSFKIKKDWLQEWSQLIQEL